MMKLWPNLISTLTNELIDDCAILAPEERDQLKIWRDKARGMSFAVALRYKVITMRCAWCSRFLGYKLGRNVLEGLNISHGMCHACQRELEL